MVKDRRYNTARKLINANALSSFSELLDTIPKTTLARDLGMHHQTFEKLLNDPLQFRFHHAVAIATLIEVEEKKIVDLIYFEIRGNRKNRKVK